MAKPETDSEFKNDEFSRIFDEYRAKIEEITRRTEKKLQSLDAAPGNVAGPDTKSGNNAAKSEEFTSEVPPEPAIRDEPEEPEETVAQVQEEPLEEADEPEEIFTPVRPEPKKRAESKKERADAEQRPKEESAEILYEARRQAKQIISEAEETVKREARKKTQAQVDKIIGKAKKESEDIIARARQAADKEKDDVVATSKNEAEQLIREITDKCRQETQAQSSKAIAEVRDRAQKMMVDVIASTTEITRLVTEIVNRAKKTIGDFESQLQTETSELAKAISETQIKLEQITAAAREEEVKPVIPAPGKSRDVFKNPTLAVRLLGDNSNGKNGSHSLFSGRVEMKSSSAFDYQYLKNLKKYLVHIPSIKYLQEYASEKEMSVLFDIKEPLPLMDILNNVPLVEQVIAESDNDICIVFKSSV